MGGPEELKPIVNDGSRVRAGFEVKVGVLKISVYKQAMERLARIGCKVTALDTTASFKDLQKFDIILMPTHCGSDTEMRKRGADYIAYVRDGGSLLVCQPNIDGTVTFLPYPITFINWYEKADSVAPAVPEHPIIADISPVHLPYPADRVKDVDKRYLTLTRGTVSKSPSLLITRHAKGRIVICTANETDVTDRPYPDKLLVRMVEWLAAKTINPTEAAKTQAGEVRNDPNKAKQIAALVKQLGDGTFGERQHTAQVLFVLGDDIVPHAEQLLMKLPATEDRTEHLKKLMAELGSDDFDVREAATEKLVAIGPEVLTAIERYADKDDPEVEHRAEMSATRLKGSAVPLSPQLQRRRAVIDILCQLDTKAANDLLDRVAADSKHEPTVRYIEQSRAWRKQHRSKDE